MLIDNITNVADTSSITALIVGIDQAMNGWLIMGCLIAILLVMAGSLYITTQDFVEALAHSLYIITILSLILFIIKVDGTRLLSFEKLSIFISLTGLTLLYKKVKD